MGPTVGEIFFIDTNVLLTATDDTRKYHLEVKKLFKSVIQAGFHLAFCRQVIREYLVVATRPVDVNGFGLRSGDAVHNIMEFQKLVVTYDEKKTTAESLKHLVVKYQLKGKRIHDANIVATMKTHGIRYLMTDNSADFKCFEDIETFNINKTLEIIE
jgi:predicted nucleic acid-binding protein